jgi:hypothetical protein
MTTHSIYLELPPYLEAISSICSLRMHHTTAIMKTRVYKTIILPSVFYGCETWSLILREEHKITSV